MTNQCPKCGSMDLTKRKISCGGCITDEMRYGESQAWSHDVFKCKVCKTKFTIWDMNDEFEKDLVVKIKGFDKI